MFSSPQEHALLLLVACQLHRLLPIPYPIDLGVDRCITTTTTTATQGRLVHGVVGPQSPQVRAASQRLLPMKLAHVLYLVKHEKASTLAR
jgi:hypothetical protein